MYMTSALSYREFRMVTLVLFGFLLCNTLSAQQNSRKGIKKVSEYEQDYDKGKPDGELKLKLESFYDANGNLTEEVEYKDGKKDHTITYSYDDKNLKTREVEKNALGKITRISEYKYENGLKVEKITYNGESQVKSKKTYKYEKTE